MPADYTITCFYRRFIEEFLLRRSAFAVLDKEDELVPQLEQAIKLQLQPLIHLQPLPKGEISKDDFFDGQPYKGMDGKPIKRDRDLVKVWYLSDWEISFKKNAEAKRKSEEWQEQWQANKGRIERLIPCIVKKMLLPEEMAKQLAENIISKNNTVIEEQFLNENNNLEG